MTDLKPFPIEEALVKHTKRSNYYWSEGAEYNALDHHNEGQIALATSMLDLLKTTTTPSDATTFDDYAIDNFANAMKEKMRKKAAEGRGGWHDKEQCKTEFLNQLLHEHVVKGDPIDVANFCMMLWDRRERITPIKTPSDAARRALSYMNNYGICRVDGESFPEEIEETIRACLKAQLGE